MNLRSGIFIILAFVACLFAAESSAQIIPRGNGQLAFRAARSYASRAIPGVGVGRIVQSGIRNTGNQFGGNQFGGTQFGGNQFGGTQFNGNQFGGGQSFRAVPQQRFGNGFGNGNGLPAGRLIQVGRLISRF